MRGRLHAVLARVERISTEARERASRAKRVNVVAILQSVRGRLSDLEYRVKMDADARWWATATPEQIRERRRDLWRRCGQGHRLGPD